MTLRAMRDNGDAITLHCTAYLEAQGRWCNTSWQPGWDSLIQYFGLDFEIANDRARFLATFECPACGAPAATLTWSINAPGLMRGVADAPAHADTRTPEEIETDRRVEAEVVVETDRRIREAQEQRQRARELRKARKAIESGKDLIGPPNPWAYRTKGRWL